MVLFTFVSDPCLPVTIALNTMCIDYAISQGVPCQILTKRADWLDLHPYRTIFHARK